MENWIIPCNPKFYDIVKHFENNKTIIWRNAASIKAGDSVYIYLGIPYSEIKYRCKVIRDKIPDDILDQNQYAIPKVTFERYKYVEMKLECVYPEGTFGFHELKEHGLTQVQKQARVYRELATYLENTEANL